MKKSLIYVMLSVGACLLGFGVLSCGEAKEAYNCAAICETYADCGESLGIDVNEDDCVNECEDKSDQSENFKEEADQCQDCLKETESCRENYGCVDDCAGVVPSLAL